MGLKYFPFALALLVSCLGLVATDDATSKKVPYQHYAITGVHTGVDPVTGARPSRRNILEMQNDVPTWSLYIQALIAMKSDSESDLTSWFQIAGIHGRPYAPWDNVPQTNGAQLTGYCTHDSVLFPTWHRPYLAMYEQILAGHAQTIAATYSLALRAQYLAAANNFRVPYWDWASIPKMPDIVNARNVQITIPSGVVKSLPNPLLTYTFQTFPLNKTYFPTIQSPSDNDYYLARYNHTVRNPDSLGAESDYDAANMVLASDQLQYRTYYALTKSPTYNNFATQIIWGPSMEGVHGSVHVDVGGAYGHMSQLSYAGFDPIFWLHHTNVDRILAIYQAMFPATTNTNYYLTPFYEYYGTYTLLAYPANGVPDSVTTPLEPFSSNTQGTFWTSGTSQYLKTWGYSYPEIQDWNLTSAQLASNVIAQVNTMWGSATSPSKRDTTSGTVEQVIEWSVALSVSKFDLDGKSFIVRMFLGGIPENPGEWATSIACVGSFVVLPPGMGGIRPLPSMKAYDEVSLVQGLAGVGHDGQDVEVVVEYLKENFEWRVQLVDGTVVATEQLQSLEIVIQEENVRLARSIYELPTYGAKTLHPEITQGKAGGYSGKKI